MMHDETHCHYTCHINYRKGWQSHIWQWHFQSFVINDSHLLETVRSVVLIPVTSGLPNKLMAGCGRMSVAILKEWFMAIPENLSGGESAPRDLEDQFL